MGDSNLRQGGRATSSPFISKVEAGAGVGISYDIECTFHNVPFTWDVEGAKTLAWAMEQWFEETVTAKVLEQVEYAKAPKVVFDPRGPCSKMASNSSNAAKIYHL